MNKYHMCALEKMNVKSRKFWQSKIVHSTKTSIWEYTD